AAYYQIVFGLAPLFLGGLCHNDASSRRKSSLWSHCCVKRRKQALDATYTFAYSCRITMRKLEPEVVQIPYSIDRLGISHPHQRIMLQHSTHICGRANEQHRAVLVVQKSVCLLDIGARESVNERLKHSAFATPATKGFIPRIRLGSGLAVLK